MPELLAGLCRREEVALSAQAFALARLLSASRIDHLHAPLGASAASVGLLAAHLNDTSFSFAMHAQEIYPVRFDPETDNALRRRQILAADAVVTVSDYDRRHLQWIAGDSERGNIRRIYTGVDLRRFTPGPYGTGEGVVLAVGELVAKKGFVHLIEACRILSERQLDYRCLIVGDGPDQAALCAQLAQAFPPPRVEFCGAETREALIDVMRLASFIVLPGVICEGDDRDGLPTVVLEAMAMGLPAIATDASVASEVIDDGENGLLISSGDELALADAMERLLTNSTLCQTMSLAARRTANQSFDLTVNVRRLRNVFDDAVARRRARVFGCESRPIVKRERIVVSCGTTPEARSSLGRAVGQRPGATLPLPRREGKSPCC